MSVSAMYGTYAPNFDYAGYNGLNDYDDYGYHMNSSIYATAPYAYNYGFGYNTNYYGAGYLQNIQDQRSMSLELGACDEGVQRALSILNEKIVQNEQEQVGNAFNNVKNALRAKYPAASEEAITNRAHTLYQQMYGSTITQDLRSNGSSSLWQGIKQTLTLGIANKITAEENIANINNQEVARSEKFEKAAGNAIGGAAIGAAIGTAVPVIGTVIGACVGAVAGVVLGGLFSHAGKK